MYFDKKAYVKRLTPLADTDKEDFQIVSGLQNIDCNVQPSSPEATALTNGVYGETYMIYCTQSGMKSGDRITISGTFTDGVTLNKELSVNAINNWYFEPMPHFEIVAVSVKQ